jgi:hypothetical protein
MKKFLLAATLISLAVPVAANAITTVGPAAAGPVTGNVQINGTVQARCLFTTGTVTINLGELTQTDGTLDPAIVNAGTANLVGWCNGSASTMSVLSSPILLQGVHTTPTGFTDTVNFTGTATTNSASGGGPVSASDSTLAAPSAAAAVGLFSDNIVVTLSSASSPAGKMIAGAYQGSVAVTLTPAY